MKLQTCQLAIKKVEEIRTWNSVTIQYENEEGDIIYFHYSYMIQGSALGVNTENAEIYEVNIHNCFGHFIYRQTRNRVTL